jgi:hypothetical protein
MYPPCAKELVQIPTSRLRASALGVMDTSRLVTGFLLLDVAGNLGIMLDSTQSHMNKIK